MKKRIFLYLKLFLIISILIIIYIAFDSFVTPYLDDKKIDNNSSFNIEFIDVGQADATLVECDGKYMLIDGGNRDDVSLIEDILKANNINSLDIIVLTHPHEDHVGGLIGAINYAKANLILTPTLSYDNKFFDDFINNAKLRAKEIKIPKVNDEYMLGSAKVKILAVNTDETITNETSICLKIDYKDYSFIFTGDAEEITENYIINNHQDLNSTVLKVGHHGSASSTSYAFLNAIKPQYAIISLAKDNDHGFPHDIVLKRLQDYYVDVYRTDINGNIYLSADGQTISIKTDK